MSTEEEASIDSLNNEWSLLPNTNVQESATSSNSINESGNSGVMRETEIGENDSDSGDSIMILSRITKNDMDMQGNVVDHISLASTLHDVEEKLSDVLIENTKLKSILQEKDDTVRKQFNIIIVLQKEVMQICDDYREKFSEAKDIINKLKRENVELREITESKQSGCTVENILNNSNSVVQNSLMHRSVVQSEDDSTVTDDTPTERESQLIAQIRDLTQKLIDMKKNYLQIQSKLEEVEDRHAADLDQYSEQLKKSHEELKALKQKLDSSDQTELLKRITLSCKRNFERKYLSEVLFFLEQICQKSVEQNLTQVQDLPSEEISENSEDLVTYNKKLHKLITCFSERCMQHLDTKEFSKECDNIINIFKNTQTHCISEIPINNTETQKNEVADYHKLLVEEQLQSIKDEQTTMHIQKRFFTVLSDYNKVVSQLEVLKYDNLNLFKHKCEIDEDNAQNLAAIEKCLKEETRMCKTEKDRMLEERLNLEQERQAIKEDRELLEEERNALLEEKAHIIEEHREIIDENLLLNQRYTALREKESSLKTELENMEVEFNDVKQQLQTANDTIAQLRHDISQMTVNENELSAYKLQLDTFEATIVDLRYAETNFLAQIEDLSNQVHQLREQNEELRNRFQNNQ